MWLRLKCLRLNGKESACYTGDPGLIPGLGRSPGEGNGNPLQSSCLENPMDRGAWRATVRGVATESDTTERLSNKNKFTYYSLSFRTRKPGMLQPTGLQRIGHNWVTEQQQKLNWVTEQQKLGKMLRIRQPRKGLRPGVPVKYSCAVWWIRPWVRVRPGDRCSLLTGGLLHSFFFSGQAAYGLFPAYRLHTY